MFNFIPLFINLIREAKSFSDFVESIKDPKNRAIVKSTALFVFTIILAIFLVYFTTLFTTLNTPGIRSAMKTSRNNVVGNWWCPDNAFDWSSRNGTMIIIAHLDNPDKNYVLNHYHIWRAIDAVNYKEIYRAALHVTFDEESNLILKPMGSYENTPQSRYRFVRFLGYMFLYNFDAKEHLYCISQAGYVPDSIAYKPN